MVEFFDVYLYTDRLTRLSSLMFIYTHTDLRGQVFCWLFTHRLTGLSSLTIIYTQICVVEFLDDYLHTGLRGRVP